MTVDNNFENDPDLLNPRRFVNRMGVDIERKAYRRLKKLGLKVVEREGLLLIARYVGNPPSKILTYRFWWKPRSTWRQQYLWDEKDGDWDWWAHYMCRRIWHVLHTVHEIKDQRNWWETPPDKIVDYGYENRGQHPWDYTFRIKIRIQ